MTNSIPKNHNALLACIVLLAVVLGCKKMTTITPVRKSAPDFTVTATELSQEFEKDASAANAKYRGETLAVTGVSDGAMGLAIVFKTPRESKLVRCSFSEKDRDSFRQIGKMKFGEEFTLIGYCKGAQTDLPVEISDCALR